MPLQECYRRTPDVLQAIDPGPLEDRQATRHGFSRPRTRLATVGRALCERFRHKFLCFLPGDAICRTRDRLCRPCLVDADLLRKQAASMTSPPWPPKAEGIEDVC